MHESAVAAFISKNAAVRNPMNRNPMNIGHAVPGAIYLGIVALVLAFVMPGQADADEIDLGRAGDYTVFSLGGDELTLGDVTGNSTTIFGDVAVGAGPSGASGPVGTGFFQKGLISETLYVDQNAKIEIVDKNFTVGLVDSGADLTGAVDDAISRSSFYAGLVADPLGDFGLNSADKVLSAGVYSADSFMMNSGSSLTITGGASDIFVLNISGQFDFTKSFIELSGGITANNVLFNVIGTGLEVKVDGDNSIFQGTLLAVDRDLIISGLGTASPFGAGSGNAGFTGRLIGALDHSMINKSGAELTAVAPIPEPEIYAMMAVGMGFMGWVARRKKRRQAPA